ncbi:hypothetical protein [Halomarina ordinaria]|uniref:Lipoprotein n=1 Tax=Halomarina ordinaria TaxID=3033939 RepID=A0ABD5U4D9_9EURY|nr:hypothetical protein [Halomarina sp. PSRA2]
MRRRTLLSLSGSILVGLAGCLDASADRTRDGTDAEWVVLRQTGGREGEAVVEGGLRYAGPTSDGAATLFVTPGDAARFDEAYASEFDGAAAATDLVRDTDYASASVLVVQRRHSNTGVETSLAALDTGATPPTARVRLDAGQGGGAAFVLDHLFVRVPHEGTPPERVAVTVETYGPGGERVEAVDLTAEPER